MADISKIQLSDDIQYNLKDAVARSLLTENDTSTGDISKIQLSDNTQYNIKDAVARQDIETVTTDVKAQVNADKDLINGGDNFIDDETLDDYDDKIAEMQEAYKKFIPIQTTSGTEITLDNSSNDKALVDIGLDGNTEQVTYTGSQLIDFGTLSNSNTTNSFTNDTLTVSTSTGTYANAYKDITTLYKGNAGKVLRFDFSSISSDVTPNVRIVGLRIIAGSTSNVTLVGADKSISTHTIPNDTSSITSVSLTIYANNTNTPTTNTLTIVKPMFHFGSTEIEYEPYTGRNCLT